MPYLFSDLFNSTKAVFIYIGFMICQKSLSNTSCTNRKFQKISKILSRRHRTSAIMSHEEVIVCDLEDLVTLVRLEHGFIRSSLTQVFASLSLRTLFVSSASFTMIRNGSAAMEWRKNYWRYFFFQILSKTQLTVSQFIYFDRHSLFCEHTLFFSKSSFNFA